MKGQREMVLLISDIISTFWATCFLPPLKFMNRCIEQLNLIWNQKQTNFRYALALLGPCLLFIHKLQLWTTIDLTKVDPSETFKSKPLPWSFTDRIGLYDVQFTVHPKGSVMIYVISSSKPFRLYNEQDVMHILTFLGMVEDRFRFLLSDSRGRCPCCKKMDSKRLRHQQSH